MESFRNMVRGWLGYTILGLIVLGLAVTGIEAYFSGGKLTAAEVNGKKILQADLDRMVERQRQQMMARMGPDADPSLLDVARIRESVLDGLITRELLSQRAHDQGFLVSDATVNKLIRQEPAFQEDGKFSQRRYEQALQQIGEHPATYPAHAKQELGYSTLVGGLGQSGIVTQPELERLSALTNQRRDIHFVMLPSARYLSQVAASDDEIKAFYAAHAERYTTPEAVSLEYITLKRDDFLAEAAPTEDELKARYEEKVKASGSDERRQAQHILITVDDKTKDADALKKIRDIEKRARAGEDFGKLAKEFSQDPGSVASGGDLGMVGHGMFVPEFEKTLFSLKQGEISAPVKTQFGYHLIKLNKIEIPAAPSFAAQKPALEREVREAKAEELFGEAVDKLDASVYESSDLKEPAEKFKRSIQTTPLFTTAGGAGLASDRKVVEAAFSDDLLKEGKNSQGLRLADGSVVWVRVKEHKPSAQQPLAEVAADVRNQVLLQKAAAMARSAADAVKAALAKGSSLDAVAAQEKLSWQHVPDATRHTPLPLPDIQRLAFQLPHPVAGRVSADSFDTGTAQVIVAVSKVTPGQPSAEAELAQVRNALSENRSQQELLDYIRFLRETESVKIRKQ